MQIHLYSQVVGTIYSDNPFSGKLPRTASFPISRKLEGKIEGVVGFPHLIRDKEDILNVLILLSKELDKESWDNITKEIPEVQQLIRRNKIKLLDI